MRKTFFQTTTTIISIDEETKRQISMPGIRFMCCIIVVSQLLYAKRYTALIPSDFLFLSYSSHRISRVASHFLSVLSVACSHAWFSGCHFACLFICQNHIVRYGLSPCMMIWLLQHIHGEIVCICAWSFDKLLFWQSNQGNRKHKRSDRKQRQKKRMA